MEKGNLNTAEINSFKKLPAALSQGPLGKLQNELVTSDITEKPEASAATQRKLANENKTLQNKEEMKT